MSIGIGDALFIMGFVAVGYLLALFFHDDISSPVMPDSEPEEHALSDHVEGPGADGDIELSWSLRTGDWR
jgi:hypothetical protein